MTPSSSRIPPLLAPHVKLPAEESIILLTSTLGASANWLITRFLCDGLSSGSSGVVSSGGDGAGLGEFGGQGHSEEVNVLMVSWMREYEFWKQEARKGAGVDLERARREGRFAFVDGLTGLFLPFDGQTRKSEEKSLPVRTAPPTPPARMGVGAVPARGPSAASGTMSNIPDNYSLKSPDLTHLKSTLATALSNLSSARKTLLVFDNPDILLAASPLSSPITPTAITSLLLTLHADAPISHILIHLQADHPLLGLSTPPQPMEIMQRNLVVKMAHMSRRVLGVRVLDTGVARDVSGVLRVTENEGVVLGRREGGKEEDGGSRREMLFKVNGDGSVRVFERGAGGEG